jgi:hypothetical protein
VCSRFGSGNLDFLVNGEMHHNDQPVKVGELQVWDVVNVSLMDLRGLTELVMR